MLREYLSNIADKFRTHLDTTEPINAQDFAGKVEDVAVRHNQLGFTNGYNLGLEEGKPLGKLELLQNSEYMNAKVSGTAIAVNDVSPIEHSVGCVLGSKNLFDVNLGPHSMHYDVSLVSLNDGELTIKQNCNTAFASYNIAIPNANNLVGKTITISCDCKVGEGGNNTTVRVLWVNANGNSIAGTDILYKPYVSSTEYQHISVSGVVNAQPDESHDTLVLMFYSNVTGTISDGEYYAYFKNIQIEIGTTATEYTPYVTDVGGIEVSRLGKNLALAKDVYKGSFKYDVVEFEGRTAVTFIDSSETLWSGISFKPNTQYTVSFDARVAEHNPVTTENSGLFCFVYSDGQRSWILSQRNTEWEHFTLTSVAGKTVVSIGIASYNYQNKNYIDCNSFQLEEGSTATAYEPYNRTTYQSTADGTVKGVTSISPNMTLLTNNNGVVINANYLRDIDTYIDNLKTNVALTGGE